MRILTQNEQKLLGSTQGKDRDEATAFSVDDVMDRVAEAGLPLLPLLMNVCAICGLLKWVTTKSLLWWAAALIINVHLRHKYWGKRGHQWQKKKISTLKCISTTYRSNNSLKTYCNENVRLYAGNLSGHEMPILLTREIPCVQYLRRETRTVSARETDIKAYLWRKKRPTVNTQCFLLIVINNSIQSSVPIFCVCVVKTIFVIYAHLEHLW